MEGETLRPTDVDVHRTYLFAALGSQWRDCMQRRPLPGWNGARLSDLEAFLGGDGTIHGLGHCW
jgi:hypothetical protein